MTETFVPFGPLRLWTEQCGNPEHPAVLLIAGAGLHDALVDRLVAGGRQVIRFDHPTRTAPRPPRGCFTNLTRTEQLSGVIGPA